MLILLNLDLQSPNLRVALSTAYVTFPHIVKFNVNERELLILFLLQPFVSPSFPYSVNPICCLRQKIGSKPVFSLSQQPVQHRTEFIQLALSPWQLL